MSQAQKLGYLFEDTIHNELDELDIFDKIYRETTIKKKYGSNYDGVDHLLYIDDYMITVQDKWQITSPHIAQIDQFISITNKIKNKIGRELLCALFVSKITMTQNGKVKLDDENEKYTDDKYFAISSIDMDTAVKKTIDFIKYKLIEKGYKFDNVIEPIVLRSDQQEDVTAFKTKLLDPDGLKSGIIVKPTGAGKTIIAISCIGEYMKTSNNSILWITERIDVLKSQFDDDKKLLRCMRSKLIKNYDKFHFITWYNNKSDIAELNNILKKNDKPVFLIANTASLVYKNRYTNIRKNKFGMILIDECHWFGAVQRYEFASYAMEKWSNLKIILGFSATPLRPDKDNISRIKKIFGNGTHVYFISVMTFIDAIEKGIIVPPEYYWIETKLDKNISISDFKKSINTSSYETMLKHIEVIVNKSVTKKGIFWDQRIENIQEWKKILDLVKDDKKKYPSLSTYKIFLTHSKLENDELDKFIDCANPAILLAVEKGKEGFDDCRIDFCGNLGAVKERSSLKSQQQAGRALRTHYDTIKNITKNKGIIFDCFCFDEEEDKIKKIVSMLSNYILLLKHVESLNPSYNPNNEYNQIINMVEQDKKDGTIKLKLGDDKEIVFNITSTNLKHVEWNDMPNKIKEELKNQIYSDGITCKKAMEIIKEYVDSGYPIMSKEEYSDLCKNDCRLPIDPDMVYHNFPGWVDYLQIDRSKYYSRPEDVKKMIDEIRDEYKDEISLMGIKQYDLCELYDYCQTKDNKLPPMPIDFYKNQNYNVCNMEYFIQLNLRKKKKIYL